jgi:hypothetical protein
MARTVRRNHFIAYLRVIWRGKVPELVKEKDGRGHPSIKYVTQTIGPQEMCRLEKKVILFRAARSRELHYVC